jgi:hypothetical protein
VKFAIGVRVAAEISVLSFVVREYAPSVPEIKATALESIIINGCEPDVLRKK